MKVKLVSLERWAELRYEVPPPIGTLRKWARNGNIYPVPEKEGTQYRVRPDAVFIRWIGPYISIHFLSLNP
ncbi:excisionase [Citrobacter freundii]